MQETQPVVAAGHFFGADDGNHEGTVAAGRRRPFDIGGETMEKGGSNGVCRKELGIRRGNKDECRSERHGEPQSPTNALPGAAQPPFPLGFMLVAVDRISYV
jgi:hypothetical protein